MASSVLIKSARLLNRFHYTFKSLHQRCPLICLINYRKHTHSKDPISLQYPIHLRFDLDHRIVELRKISSISTALGHQYSLEDTLHPLDFVL